jgi:hypothetical protein
MTSAYFGIRAAVNSAQSSTSDMMSVAAAKAPAKVDQSTGG